MSDKYARAYFERVRRDSVALQGYLAEIEALREGPPPSGGGGPGPSGQAGDPTFASVLRRSAMAARAESGRDAALASIGEALSVLDGARRVLSRKADAVRLYYVDLMPWEEAARSLGIGESTARAWCSDVFDWLDSTPSAYVLGLRRL